MKILAMDTTAKAASVSLLTEEKILAEYSVNVGLTHSQTIMPMCESLLQQAGCPVSEIDYFAVSNGPGSFTGLRIGIAAVKGLAYASSKPCVAVSTLDALSYNVPDFNGIICCVMDARCQQVYNALYLQENGGRRKKGPDRAISFTDLLEELKKEEKAIILVGDGALLCYNEYKAVLPNLVLSGPASRYQRASSVGLAALEKIASGEIISAGALVPEYLRLPQAQRELIKKRRLNP